MGCNLFMLNKRVGRLVSSRRRSYISMIVEEKVRDEMDGE
jgi:hypothetical protein